MVAHKNKEGNNPANTAPTFGALLSDILFIMEYTQMHNNEPSKELKNIPMIGLNPKK